MISFKCTKKEASAIDRIVARAQQLDKGLDRKSTVMDLVATNANGCPLDFELLESFDDFNFMHDVFGIKRHIDRITGKMGDCFLPRCYRPKRSMLSDSEKQYLDKKARSAIAKAQE